MHCNRLSKLGLFVFLVCFIAVIASMFLGIVPRVSHILHICVLPPSLGVGDLPDQDNAPVVLAKGMDELALRIVQVAEENGVSVVENVPLARSLYASTKLDREIPPELYGPVAEVLVYVLKLDQNI